MRTGVCSCAHIGKPESDRNGPKFLASVCASCYTPKVETFPRRALEASLITRLREGSFQKSHSPDFMEFMDLDCGAPCRASQSENSCTHESYSAGVCNVTGVLPSRTQASHGVGQYEPAWALTPARGRLQPVGRKNHRYLSGSFARIGGTRRGPGVKRPNTLKRP